MEMDGHPLCLPYLMAKQALDGMLFDDGMGCSRVIVMATPLNIRSEDAKIATKAVGVERLRMA